MGTKRIPIIVDSRFYPYMLLVLPAFVIYVIFYVLPVFGSFLLSLTNFNGLSWNFSFIGLKNYRFLLTDKIFLQAVGNTLFFTVAVVILQNSIALVVALGLNERLKTRDLLRTIIFMPCLITPVFVGFIWSFLYEEKGAINTFLQMIGLGGVAQIWLANPTLAKPCIVIAHIWIWIGYCAALYLANLQSIPQDIVESSYIDGCNAWTRFLHITFPFLAPATTVNISMSFAGTLQIFDIIFSMTNGGPGNASETIGTFMVKQIRKNISGYAASSAVVLFGLSLVATVCIYGFLKRREKDLW
jgi:raffinose/stachyose/melibiose transport system permease protein